MTEIVGSPSRAELTTTQVLRLPTTLSHLTPSLERATDGQQEGAEVDASGNPILKDAGKWLRNEIKKNIRDVDMKYIDPSYIIRSIPTTSVDRIYCKILAHNAVHGGICGVHGRDGGACQHALRVLADRGGHSVGPDGRPEGKALEPAQGNDGSAGFRVALSLWGCFCQV